MFRSSFEIIECFENTQTITARCLENPGQELREDNAYAGSVMNSMGHSHDYFQCIYVVKAKNISFNKNFTEYNLIDGCVYIVKPNERHRYIYKNNPEYKFFEIKFNVKTPQLLTTINALPEIISDSQSGQLKEVFEEIVFEYKNSDFKDDLKYVKLYELILKFNRLSVANIGANQLHINPYLESTEIYLPIFDYINDNYMNPLTLKDLADIICMQRNYFAKQFKKAFAISPMRYLKYVRIEKSANLLRYTNLPIQKISDQVGYENQNSYTKAFKEFYSVSPTVFRKNTKNALLIKYKQKI